jgi:hydrogenase maturation protein HypF
MDELVELPLESQEEDGSKQVRLKIKVGGIVQGVGFRPFIYRLAVEHDVAGYVLNNPEGVEIEAEGRLDQVSRFLSGIATEKPPQARVDTLSATFMDLAGDRKFVIRTSEKSSGRATLISPDIATCKDCLNELKDDNDRRYGYPFINCTNCGPRYTIIRDIPYDRELTTMHPFKMCPECMAEYTDPMNRRFHAEPNACWTCGPRVVLRDHAGALIETADPIAAAREALAEGKVVAVKGLGGFHLAANATDDQAVRRLRERKRREEKPLALMARDLETVRSFAHVGKEEARVLESAARPIVLLRRLEESRIAESVAPGNPNVGVMLPYTPVHHLLLEGDFLALVMTSGNISEEPISIDMDDASKRLGGIADIYLDHNREILTRCDDSVVRVIDDQMLFMRRSRGYVPLPMSLDSDSKSILACGPHLKNTVALTRGNQVFLSQHIGDLENLHAFEFFKSSVEQIKKVVDAEPEVVAYDLHPDYLSTRFALELPLKTRIGIQHHHAHIASCLGEAGVDGPVLGMALDGTGYGPDGTIWGCELLISMREDFDRVGHLKQVMMPGGDKAVKQPWRMALSHLYEAFDHDLDGLDLKGLLRQSEEDIEIVKEMLAGKVNSPVTSSAGRLFDAVSCLCGIRSETTYEGQAAIELEMAADSGIVESYPVEIEEEGGMLVIGTRRLIREVIVDVEKGESAGAISARFHNWLKASLVKAAEMLRQTHRISRVALSGGCFQNETLLRDLRSQLRERGFDVIINEKVPPNDGGISFGQVVVAAARLEAHGDD